MAWHGMGCRVSAEGGGWRMGGVGWWEQAGGGTINGRGFTPSCLFKSAVVSLPLLLFDNHPLLALQVALPIAIETTYEIIPKVRPILALTIHDWLAVLHCTRGSRTNLTLLERPPIHSPRHHHQRHRFREPAFYTNQHHNIHSPHPHYNPIW
ncbi:hypothetical protein BJ508DRAFT_39260 [Ascobolus immersus RN42]|uniref:Uncharacterized protein n=1 Tax=Ascobolus immersus RN42 TaxID=1160509 RepID=A0A3N4HK54_ASCIM|nr:hypothetical protein BJ508DRAFT_39260 [Ascobolus immersus RN42]